MGRVILIVLTLVIAVLCFGGFEIDSLYNINPEVKKFIDVNGILAKKIGITSDNSIVIFGDYKSYNDSPCYIDKYKCISTNKNGCFIAKYDSLMILQWVKDINITQITSLIGNTRFGSVSAVDLEIDSKDNIVVSGTFSGNLNIDNELVLKSSRWQTSLKSYIIKISNHSEILWSKKLKYNLSCKIKNICLDSSDNIYMTGSYVKEFFNFSFGKSFLDSFFNDNLFIGKISANGRRKWFRKFKSEKQNSGTDLCYLNGNLYVIGYYEKDLQFSKGKILKIDSEVQQHCDVFIAKLSALNGEKKDIRKTSYRLFFSKSNPTVQTSSDFYTFNIDLKIFPDGDNLYVTGFKDIYTYLLILTSDPVCMIYPEQILTKVSEKLEIKDYELQLKKLQNFSYQEGDTIFTSYLYRHMHGIIKNNELYSEKYTKEITFLDSTISGNYYYLLTSEISSNTGMKSNLVLKKYNLNRPSRI